MTTIIKCRGVWRVTANGDITVFREKKPNHGRPPEAVHHRTRHVLVRRATGIRARAYTVTAKGYRYVAMMRREARDD